MWLWRSEGVRRIEAGVVGRPGGDRGAGGVGAGVGWADGAAVGCLGAGYWVLGIVPWGEWPGPRRGFPHGPLPPGCSLQGAIGQ